jgi:HEAT repeat protein
MNPKLLLCLALVLSGGLFNAHANGMGTNASMQLVKEFKDSKVFWKQFEIANQIVARGDTNVLTELANELTNEDRHARGNTAFIFARLGDDRGFEVIRGILNDRSDRPEGQGVPGGKWTLQAQIASDRYYAIHLFGDLKDPRAVPILIPLLHDKEVNYIVPWALGENGDKRAVQPLIEALNDKDPSMRVLAIYSLEKLRATKALPRLQVLLNDNDRSDFGDRVSVAEAAKAAITSLKTKPSKP